MFVYSSIADNQTSRDPETKCIIEFRKDMTIFVVYERRDNSFVAVALSFQGIVL